MFNNSKRRSLYIKWNKSVIFSLFNFAGCNFHFGQAVYRKLRTLGMETEFAKDPKLNSACRSVLALAYCPRNKIKYGWRALLEMPGFPIARDSEFARACSVVP